MITYLLNFTLCSALLLIVYKLLLQNKAMYRFNRCYLLLSLLFSLIVPLVNIQRPVPILQSIDTTPAEMIVEQVVTEQAPQVNATPVQTINVTPQVNYYAYGIIAVYLFITGIMLFRMIRNLLALRQMVIGNEVEPYHYAWLVLIKQKVTAHTFFNYIFLNQHDYQNGQIDPAVLHHEFAHVKQRHTLDIIVIELLRALCWFNPVLVFYGRAIRLNHEFLADAAALKHKHDVTTYQHLLLNQLSFNAGLSITSQFNYSITKQRLIMMTKTTTLLTSRFTKLVIIGIAAAAAFLFSNSTQAFQQPVPKKVKFAKPQVVKVKKPAKKAPDVVFPFPSYPSTKEGVSQQMLNEYAAIVNKYDAVEKEPGKNYVQISDDDKKKLELIYRQMSSAQQKLQRIGFRGPSPILPKVIPTQEQLDQWKDTKMYGVWINNKRVKNEELNNYKPDDINQVFVSKLSPNAINYPYHKYQVDLMTADAYQKYTKEPREPSTMYHRFPPNWVKRAR